MLDLDAVHAVVAGRHRDPFSVLGMHTDEDGRRWLRSFQPGAAQVEAWTADGSRQLAVLSERHADGFFEGPYPANASTDYRLQLRWADGSGTTLDDPYRFPPVLGDMDVWLMGEGTHLRPFEVLGATQREMLGVSGVSFAVWAPNASRVSVVGDFNFWDGRRHPMRLRRECGVWEIFLPGLAAGVRYKFELVSREGELLPQKADPYALQSRTAPGHRQRRRPHARAAAALGISPEGQRAGRADEHLRGPPRLLAAQARGGQPLAELGRTRIDPGALHPRDGLHPPRTAAGLRAPLRRLLGLPADRHVRADLADSGTRQASAASSSAAMPKASA